MSSWKLKILFSKVPATSLSRLRWTCEADFTNHDLFPFTWKFVESNLWKMGITQIFSSAWRNQSCIYNIYQSYLALKMLHGWNSLNLPKQFALLVQSSPSSIFIFCYKNLRQWLLVSRMENTTHTCCGFPHQECKNHFDHPVTLLCTLSTLWAQCPELETAKPPLCWAKEEQSLTSLKNNSFVCVS